MSTRVKLVNHPGVVNCYIVVDRKEAIIIDPAGDADRIISTLQCLKVNPIGIVLTHTHSDHTQALKQLRKQINLPLMFHPKEDHSSAQSETIFLTSKADTWLKEGDLLHVGDIGLKIWETPGLPRKHFFVN